MPVKVKRCHIAYSLSSLTASRNTPVCAGAQTITGYGRISADSQTSSLSLVFVNPFVAAAYRVQHAATRSPVPTLATG
jgi:lipocalin